MRTLAIALAASALTAPIMLHAQAGADETVTTRKEQIAETKQVFKMLDENKDGAVSLKEIEQLVSYGASIDAPPGTEPTAEEMEDARTLFKLLDANGDGKVTLAEMTRWMLRGFDCQDANHDGKLTQSESDANEQKCEAAQAQ